MTQIENQIIDDILSAARVQLSDILPSEWAEKYRFMTSDVSPMEGMFRFDNSPYTRELADTFSPSHPARIIVMMKGAQLGLSTAFIENVIGWIVSQQPGNILYLVGHDDLVEKAMKKVDNMIDTTGIRKLIRSTANRAKNNKSGDKDRMKEFNGGYLTLGPTNHKTLRQISMKYGFIDDFESMKGATKESGGTVPMIMQRFAAYSKSMKLAFISTPELKETSNIEPEFLKGDQRRFFVPCPCCGEYIVLFWDCESEINPGDRAGITWSLNESSELIYDSVGYTCQKCGDSFTDQFKTDMLLNGEWRPTATPKDPTYTSYHISSLYAPSYMYGWSHYVTQYLTANPPGQPRNEYLHQTFVNLVLGETYEMQGETIDASQLERNIRPYQIGIIPEKQSIADGNGKIVMLTIGADMNGTAADAKSKFEDDARLDWELIAWSETGAKYSVNHGSIGTFQPAAIRNDAYHNHPDRVKWSYKFGAQKCVWDEFQNIINQSIQVDTGRRMSVFATGLDCGHLSEYAYPFIDNSPSKIYGVKGDKDHSVGIQIDADYRPFQISRNNANLYILNVNTYKDQLATHIGLLWNPHLTPKQPAGFMNFPTPENGKYTYEGFFSHFEAEHKIADEKSRKFVWKKRSQNSQNHFWDCRIYAVAACDIFLMEIFRELKIKNGSWRDYIALVTQSK